MAIFKSTFYLTALLFLLVSCKDDINQNSEVIKVKKHPYKKISDAERFQDPNANLSKPNHTTSYKSAHQFSYQLPENWLLQKPRQFRDVNIGFKEDKDAACYLTVLNKNGGGILPNINRWRGEFNLKPLSKNTFKDGDHITFFDQQVSLIILSGNYKNKHEGWAMLACFYTNGSKAFTLKFVGPEELIANHKANFIQFSKSIKEQIK